MHIDTEKPERGYCSLWQKENKESSLCAMHLCQSQLVPCSLPGTSSGISQHKAALLPREGNLSAGQLLLSAAAPGADTNTSSPGSAPAGSQHHLGLLGFALQTWELQTGGRFTKCSLPCTFTHLTSPGRLTIKTMTKTKSPFSC